MKNFGDETYRLNLQVWHYITFTPAVLQVNGQYYNYDKKRILPFNFSKPLLQASSYTPLYETDTSFYLGPGEVTALTFNITGGTVKPGFCYTSLSLQKNQGGNENDVDLFSGYVYTGDYGGKGPETDGTPTIIYGTDPGAGLGFLFTVPSFVNFKLQGVSFKLVTDANAGTREPYYLTSDGTRQTGFYNVSLAGFNQNPSQTRFWRGFQLGNQYTRAVPSNVFPVTSAMGFPMELIGGFQFNLLINAIQVGDLLSEIGLFGLFKVTPY